MLARLWCLPHSEGGAEVTAIEINPDACRYLRKNIRENGGVEDVVTVFEGDAMQLLPSCGGGGFDRAIVPTPYGMNTALDEVIPLVSRGGGVIHFSTFTVPPEETDILAAKFRGMGCVVNAMRRCGDAGTGVSRWVFDLRRR